MADSKFNLKDIGEGIVGAFLIAVAFLTPFVRPRRNRWGLTDAEAKRSLPGDELVPQPKYQWTHAVAIRASAAEIWPWLAQMGQGRGGFYSYEWLENLVGCGIHNADSIIPEFQHLAVGDNVRLHPTGPALTVAVLEPGWALVLNRRVDTQTGNPFERTDKMPKEYVNGNWAFYLVELGDGTTRLISRSRNDYNPSLGHRLVYGPFFTEPICFVMDRKMLLGIKQRAEAALVTSTKKGG